MGRTGVDIYPLQFGVGLEDVETFQKFLGGTATNVAVAAARHGRDVALVTRTGADAFGRYIHRALREFGVDDRFVEPVDGPPTPVTFCEVFPPDDFPLYFYRYPTAPDLLIEPQDLPLDAIRDARVYWSTVTGLSQEPSRSAHFAAWAARARRPHTVLDLDYRPMFWPEPGRGERPGRPSPRARHRGGRQPRGVRGGGRRDRPAAGGRRPARARGRAGGGEAGPQGRARRDPRGARRGGAVPGDGGQRARGRRRVRGRAGARAPRGLGPAPHHRVRQRGRGDRRLAPGVLQRDAHDGRGAGHPRRGRRRRDRTWLR